MRSPCDWLRCTTVQLTAAATGTHSAIREPSNRPDALAVVSDKAVSIWLPYI
ncbi:hypothetical protein D9M68_705470 [compost metagenome]